MLLARFSKAPQTMSSNKDRTKQIEKLLQQFEDAGADKRPKVDKVKITRKRARVMHQGSERSERSNQIEGATNLLSLADELEAFIQSVVPGSVSVNSKARGKRRAVLWCIYLQSACSNILQQRRTHHR